MKIYVNVAQVNLIAVVICKLSFFKIGHKRTNKVISIKTYVHHIMIVSI